MAPIRPSQSSSSFSQPPKGTQHKQRACKHARNKSSDSEDGETTNKASKTCKCKRDSTSSADEAGGSRSTRKTKTKKKKQKKPTASTDTADEGDGSEDEASPQDQAPEDMDENEQALSTSLISKILCFTYLYDRESCSRLDVSSVRSLPLASVNQGQRWHRQICFHLQMVNRHLSFPLV